MGKKKTGKSQKDDEALLPTNSVTAGVSSTSSNLPQLVRKVKEVCVNSTDDEIQKVLVDNEFSVERTIDQIVSGTAKLTLDSWSAPKKKNKKKTEATTAPPAEPAPVVEQTPAPVSEPQAQRQRNGAQKTQPIKLDIGSHHPATSTLPIRREVASVLEKEKNELANRGVEVAASGMRKFNVEDLMPEKFKAPQANPIPVAQPTAVPITQGFQSHLFPASTFSAPPMAPLDPSTNPDLRDANMILHQLQTTMEHKWNEAKAAIKSSTLMMSNALYAREARLLSEVDNGYMREASLLLERRSFIAKAMDPAILKTFNGLAKGDLGPWSADRFAGNNSKEIIEMIGAFGSVQTPYVSPSQPVQAVPVNPTPQIQPISKPVQPIQKPQPQRTPKQDPQPVSEASSHGNAQPQRKPRQKPRATPN